jgi:hypothetical protein
MKPEDSRRPHIRVRGIYGGVPTHLLERGQTLADYGVNAIFLGSGSLTAERVALLKAHGAQVFAEFNSMHDAGYLEEHPDAAPVGADGEICPPPDGWQGLCPTHPGYREFRMQSFREVLQSHDADGIWLDYHHSHASWEQAEPNLPDTCFCDRCVARFAAETGTKLPNRPRPEQARFLLTEREETWVQWRCAVFTDWVREYRDILHASRPHALLGTFHCPWTDTEREGALRKKLAIDLKAQAEYVDVFSIMPYHARFGHATEPAWISRQVDWLGRHLGIAGEPGERHRIWPIVQLSDWGEAVPVSQMPEVLDHGTRSPATGVMVFAWGSLQSEPEKVDAMGEFYRSIGGE